MIEDSLTLPEETSEPPNSPVIPLLDPSSHRKNRIKGFIRLLTHFFIGQGLSQFVSLGTGFLIIRWMDVTSYAQYSVAFAFQSTLNILVDLGFSNSIVALVGDRIHDKDVIGGYIKAARHQRMKMFFIIGTASAVAFPIVVMKQPWPLGVKAVLWLAVVTAVFFDGFMLYSAPLLMHKRLKDYYRAGLTASMVRLALVAILHGLGGLFGWVGAWFAGLMSSIKGYMYRHSGKDLVNLPDAHNPELAKEMRGYLMPLWPPLIFYAFQGQIQIALISYFGKTQNIAEVAALGRIGQIFVLLGALNGTVIEPLIAKSSFSILARRYFTVVFAFIATCLLLYSSIILFPHVWLWIIGAKYSHLGTSLELSVAGAIINLVVGVICVMNNARRWVFWSNGIATILVVGGIDILAMCFFNLSSTNSVLWLGIWTGLILLLINAVTGLFGYSKNRSILMNGVQI